MATIGVASASYYANASIQQFDRASINSVERISKAKNEIANGDAATLAAMDYTFKLDLAGTQAALKNIAVTQAYLSTAITSIDSASAILAKIQELAVMGANSTNSDVQMAGINAEAEALADEFHKAIINANYKGKQIFTDDQIGANLSIGGGGQIGNYTIAVLDYDDFYDVKNPNTESLLDGVEYEVTRDLSDIEKEAIVARTDGVSVEDLTTGFRFKTNNVSLENVGIGVVKMRDDTSVNVGNTANDNLAEYKKTDPNIQPDPVIIDSGAYISVEGEFNGGSIEFSIAENWETSDVLSLADTDKISFRDDGEIIYHTTVNGVASDVEIGKLNSEIDGVTYDGLAGKPLLIELYSDATVPGTSVTLKNGDFEAPEITAGFEPYKTYTPGVRRENSINEYEILNNGGSGYSQKNDTTSTGLARGSDTYNVTFQTLEGPGSGFRANLRVNNDGSISIVEVLDKGEGYDTTSVLGLADGTLRPEQVTENAADFKIKVLSVIEASPVGQGTSGVEVVSDADFIDVDYYEQQTEAGIFEWGERYDETNFRKVAIDEDGAALTAANGRLDYYRQTVNGSYAIKTDENTPYDFDFGGVAIENTSLINHGRYNNVDKTLDFSDQDIVLEQIVFDNQADLQAYQPNAGEIAVYEIDADGQRVQIDVADGESIEGANQKITTDRFTVDEWNNLSAEEKAQYFSISNVYETEEGVIQTDYIPIEVYENPRGDDVAVYGNTQRYDEYPQNLSAGAIIETVYAEEKQIISTVNYVPQAGDIAVPGPQQETQNKFDSNGNQNTAVYVTNTSGGTYSWGEVYIQGSDTYFVHDATDPSRSAVETREYRHLSDGTYDWAATGQYTWENGDQFSANYSADEVIYEKSDVGGNGWTAIMAMAEVPEVAFYVREKTLEVSKKADHYLEDTIAHYLRAQVSHYNVREIEGYERPILTHYDAEKVSGYSRDNLLGYLKEKTLYTNNVLLGTSQKYLGEIDRPGNAHTGWDQNEGTLIRNWTKFNSQIKFGTDFTIFDFDEDELDGSIIGDIYEDGTWVYAGETVSIPTPTMEDMEVDPAYEYTKDGVTTYATDSVKLAGDDLDPVVGPTNSFVGLVNNTTDGKAGTGAKLSTGSLTFGAGDNFGVYHGPALVSDVFHAKEGQFLKLDYSAAGDDDDYHVTGYIYRVDDPDKNLYLAIGDTGTEANSRKSVEVPVEGDYRFVFIVGTYDKTGGRLAGADMTIDNIVAEEPYSIQQDAIEAILQAVQYNKTDGTTTSNPTKTLTTKITNGQAGDDERTLYEQTNINIVGYELTNEEDGPYAIVPTLNLVTKPSDATIGSSDALISKLENVHGQLRSARIQAVASYGALDAALSSVTDLRSQYAMGSSTISDLNFTQEATNLTKRQIQMDIATSMLAQANKAQEGIMALLEK